MDAQNVSYSALLTPQGKMDFDFFVWKHGDDVLLECEASRADALLERLSMFKLRRNLTFKTIAVQVFAAWGNVDALKAFSYEYDPRHAGLGVRKISIEAIDKKEINTLHEVEYDFYDRLRLSLCIPDGSRDIAWGEDTASDINLEKLNGVSYTKGCYMGQELTSRMHHRGIAKKGLYTVSISGAPYPPFTDILADGNLIGEMRSSNGDTGLAMLRHDSLKLAESTGLDCHIDNPEN